MAVSQKRWPRRLLRGVIALVMIVLLGLYVIMPLAFGFAATLPVAVTVGAPPDGFDATHADGRRWGRIGGVVRADTKRRGDPAGPRLR